MRGRDLISRTGIAILVSLIWIPRAHSAIQLPDRGQPLSSQELAAATDDLVAILKDTNYFDFVDSRVHGWPESSPKYPWWGTFWSGVTIKKENGRVRYVHSADGADNNGIHTSPYLEGACYSSVIWRNPRDLHLVRKILRGMSGWILSSSTSASDTDPKVLDRSFYPENVHSSDEGREIDFDFSRARHESGVTQPSSFVHLRDNAFFGDIFIRNQRSCDDIGHMIRALTLVEASCGAEPELTDDLDLTKRLYARWAEDVDSKGFEIPTLDIFGKYRIDGGPISRGYIRTLLGFNPFCIGEFAVRLLHSGSPGGLNCKKGYTRLEKIFRHFLKNDARQILRSHHEAAVAIAKYRGLDSQADQLSLGLVERIRRDFADARAGIRRKKFNPDDIPMLLIAAANVGIPLTSEETRWLHARLHLTRLFYEAKKSDPAFHVFDPSTPDGTYSYIPPNAPGGIYFRGLGMLLGACASPYRESVRPILDCDLLRNAHY